MSAAELPPSRPGNWRLILNNRLAAAGLAILTAVVSVSLLAPLLPLADPDVTAPANRLLPPLSENHPLGTDALGRDLLSRLIWGTRVSMAVGVMATFIAAICGSFIGLVAGYAGGRADNLMMRGIDMLMAFPYILLALMIVAALGPGLLNALYAIAIINIPFFARNVRGVTRGLAQREFVAAARLSGKSDAQIVLGEVLPNVLPVIVITMSTTVGWMILETAGLSFLGLGAQPPQADLGSMLGEGRKLLFTAPFVSVIPGVMIFVLVVGINVLGDGARDAFDPRLKSGAAATLAARTAVSRHTPPTPDAAAKRAALAFCGLRVQFQLGNETIRAVNGVSMQLEPGACLGVVGESGCGKSVTAMSAVGLTPGDIVDGGAWLAGEDLFAISDERLRQLRGAGIAMLFQDPLSALHPLHTIGAQISESILAHQPVSKAQARRQAEELLRRVRIPNPAARLNAYPHELSGGMRQRVCIAMALANDAGVLIADEPTTALDVTVQAQILSLLNHLRRRRGTAVLFISHDFAVVSAVCDRVAVMYAGQVVETGETREVLSMPAHPYTAKLIACAPVPGKPRLHFDAIDGRPPPANALPRGCAFADRCPRADGDCRAAAVEITSAGTRAVRCLHPLINITPYASPAVH